jgi:hypothetical protein
MPSQQARIGGSFAPPLSPEQLVTYKALANDCADRQCKEKILELVKMKETFDATPKSKQKGSPHPLGVGVIVPLEEKEIERIWDVVPYENECNAIGALFDQLTGDLRNAAYHLLWFARELAMDREPITTDKL